MFTFQVRWSLRQWFCLWRSCKVCLHFKSIRICKLSLFQKWNLIKGSRSSSWMNNPIPSLLLPWSKTSLCANYWYENMSPVGSFAWKSRHFHVTFSTSTHSEANSNSEVEVRSACIWKCQAAHQASTYSSFCSIRWLEVFLLPPGWDASPSQGYPQHLIC